MTTSVAEVQENLGVAPGRRRWKRILWWLGIVVLLGLGVVLLIGRYQASAAEPAVQYRTGGGARRGPDGERHGDRSAIADADGGCRQ
ncbi:MAG: hypothetical protein QM757_08630 [Paludibaculum sp.]